MEISIKTLTGTDFELRVSPFETIASIKGRIQRNEGIPISQQHIIWNSIELNDDHCLHDFDISSGATLTLVLAMRDGPINMRRVSVEEPSLQEVAEYMDANRDEMWEKLMNEEQQITLLVYKDGDQVNFFRVYDRGDGVLSPYSDSISAGSTCNASEDFNGRHTVCDKNKQEENEVTKNKMAALREKISKKNPSNQKYQPRPPSAPKPKSKHLSRRSYITAQGAHVNTSKLNEKEVGGNSVVSRGSYELPPVRATSFKQQQQDSTDHHSTLTDSRRTSSILSNIAEVSTSSQHVTDDLPAFRKNIQNRTIYPSTTARPKTLEKGRDNLSASRRSVLKPLGALDKTSASGLLSGLKSPPIESMKKGRSVLPDILKEKTDNRSTVTTNDNVDDLESLIGQVRPNSNHSVLSHTSDLRKSGKTFYRRTSKSYRRTPDGRLSSKLISNSRSTDKRPLSALKKKKRARCIVCAKKLGIATTYQCRCANKFCATHRYPETHNCTYDYKTEGRKFLEKNNPVVTAPKLPKI